MVRQLSLVLALALSAAVVLTSIGASHPGSDTDACQHSNNGHAPGIGHGICTLERGGPAQQGPTPVDTPHTHCAQQCSVITLMAQSLLFGSLLVAARFVLSAAVLHLQLLNPPLSPPPQLA